MAEMTPLSEKELKTYETLKSSKELFVVVSLCTKLPYAYCRPETFDDEVLLYTDTELAKTGSMKLLEQKIPLQLAKLENEQLRFFYSSLYSMGINAIALNWNTDEEQHLQLNRLIVRPDASAMPKDAVVVENPSLLLTSMYLLQEARKAPTEHSAEKVKELNEEMLADLRRGTFIAVGGANNEMPLVKLQNGETYFPVFTDALEFGKFNTEGKFKPRAVNFELVTAAVGALKASGIVLNPYSLNLQLKITPPQPQQRPGVQTQPETPAQPAPEGTANV